MSDGAKGNEVLEFERDQLARDLREAVARREALEERLRELGLSSIRLRREAEEAEHRARVAEQRVEAFQAGSAGAAEPDEDAKRARERRVLIAEVVEVRAELERRTAQLVELRGSRFHRVAGTTWQLRRRRTRLAALAAALLALLAAVVLAATGFLPAAAALAVLALAAAAVLVTRSARDHEAGEARWRERLRKESARAVEITRAGADERAAARAPSDVRVERRLVPAPRVTPAVPLSPARVDPRELRVACVLDEMSQACFAPECDLMPVGRVDWREQLERQPPHLLLVESAWNGSGGAWQWSVASYDAGPEVGLGSLRAMVAWCREHGIPTVFWNKEDPVHFERFRAAAALFDHVFTTDADRIGAYEALGSDTVRTVAALPFAAQPRLHNPVGALGARDGRPAFAGSYYRDRHEARRTDLELLLDAARPLGLAVYDRMAGHESAEFGFPERFRPHIRGRLSYADTLAAYRRHSVFLNVNSVIDSPTMCSRRVFELLACGTPVVSTPARALDELLGDAVTVVSTAEEATAALDRLVHDEAHWRAASARGRRAVAGHGYAERLHAIVRAAGFDVPEQRRSAVAALVVASDAERFGQLAAELRAQRLAPEEIVVGAPSGLGIDAALGQLREQLPQAKVRLVHQAGELTAEERARELASLATAGWVAPLSEGRSYGPGHLEGLMACAAFGDAEVIGRDPAPGHEAGEHAFADRLDPDTAIARREAVARWGWPRTADGLEGWFRRGARLYRSESGAADPVPSPGPPPSRQA